MNSKKSKFIVDYEFKDTGLKQINNAIVQVKDKKIARDKAIEALGILQAAEAEIDALKIKRNAYAEEMAGYKEELATLEGSMTESYYSLDESDQNVKRSRMAALLLGGIGFLIGYGIGSVNGWFGIFCFLVGIVGFGIGAAIGAQFDDAEEAKARQNQVNLVRERKGRHRKQTFDSYFEGILTGEQFDHEASMVRQQIHNAESAIKVAINGYMEQIKNLLQEAIDITRVEAKITADEFDRNTQGKPVIKWNAPKYTFPSADANPEEYLREGAGRLTELAVKHKIFVKISIYFNEGRRLEANFSQNGTLLYSDTFGAEGEFVHADAIVGKTFHYYLVTEFEYMGFTKQGSEIALKPLRQEILHCAEVISIKPFKSEAQALEEEISEHTIKQKRKKFHEKIGKNTEEGEVSIASAAEEQTRQILERKRAQRETDQAIEKMRKDLADAGLSEHEIDEAVEEFLQRI